MYMLPSGGQVKILQPVAICTIIFVTGGHRVTKADTKCQMRQVGPEPFQRQAPDAHPLLQTINQDVMVHCIKSRS